MNYLGDFPTSGRVSLLWNTQGANGSSITRATDGSVRIYKANATTGTWETQRSSSNGITEKEDFDSLTGVHSITIDLSDNTDAGFYAAGNEYQIVYTGMTIDGQSVNAAIASFSIERSGGALALLKDATYGLSAIETLVDDLEGRITATRAGYLDNLTRLDVDVSTRSTYAGADTAGTTTLLTRLSAARAGYLDNLSGGAVALASSILDAAGIRSALGLAAANLDTQLAALPTADENADALIARNIEGGSSAGRTIAQALAFLRNKWEVSGGTLTVYGADDSTTSWTASVTQTAGNPVSAVDPA